MIWSLKFWRGASERAIKTFAQVLAATFVLGVPVFDLDVTQGLAISATAAAASLLTSIGNADFTAGSDLPLV